MNIDLNRTVAAVMADLSGRLDSLGTRSSAADALITTLSAQVASLQNQIDGVMSQGLMDFARTSSSGLVATF